MKSLVKFAKIYILFDLFFLFVAIPFVILTAFLFFYLGLFLFPGKVSANLDFFPHGAVFYDRNQNGIFDEDTAEVIGGVTLSTYSSFYVLPNLLETTTSSAITSLDIPKITIRENYRFSFSTPRYIEIRVPEGYRATTPTSQTTGFVYDIFVPSQYFLREGGGMPHVDFGLVFVPTPTPIPLPDLTVSDLNPPNISLVLPGQVRFSGQVRNISTGAQAGQSRAVLLIDYNFNPQSISFDPPSPLLSDVGSLTAGSSQEVSWNVSNVSPGIHAYAICADVQNSVNESSENNNCDASVFVVPYPPSFFSMSSSTTNTPPACLLPGQSYQPFVRTSWTPSNFATHYALYRSVNGGDAVNITTLSSSQTSYDDTNVVPGSTYRYAVFAYNANFGTYAWSNNPPQISPPTQGPYSPSIQVPATPPSCTPPTISLNIDQGLETTTWNGSYGTSGRQTTDAGSNWLNSIYITLNASPQSSGATIKEYYLNFSPGFSLYYDSVNRISKVNEINIGGLEDVGYDVFEGGSRSYTVFPVNPPNLNSAKWRVIFRPAFGSRNNISTTGYVKDSNNLCSNNSCSPVELTPSRSP